MTRDDGTGHDRLFWTTPAAAKRVLIALHVAALASIAIEAIFPLHEDPHGIERVHALDFLGSYAAYGFFACVLLVLLGIVLRRIVIRDENYYGDAEE